MREGDCPSKMHAGDAGGAVGVGGGALVTGAEPSSASASPSVRFVDAAFDRHADKTGQLLNVLNDVQGAYRYLPAEAVERIAERMGVPVEQIMRMGAFFNNLSLDPVGRCIIDVCDGTACHTQGASQLMAEFEKKLGISVGETTADGAITLRAVGCVGACGIAPVVVVEGDAYGRVGVTQVGDVAAIGYKRASAAVEEARAEGAGVAEGER